MERIWCDHYEQGVAATVDVAPFQSLVESFDSYTDKFSANAVFSNFGVSLSYTQLRQQADQFAAFLQQHCGLVKGDRVAVMLPNLLQYPLSVFGVLKAGGVVVNVNPLYTARELRHQLKDSGATVIVVCANFARTLQEVIEETSVKHVIVTELGDRLGGLKGAALNFIVKHVKRMVPKYCLPGAIDFNSAMAKGAATSLKTIGLSGEDVAFLQYTGGTTGPSKGAILTHANMVANAAQLRAWVKSIVVPGKDVVVTPLPLYHIFSLTVCCIAFIGLGAECMLITNPRDIGRFVKILRKNCGTIFVGINTLYNALADHPKIGTVDFSGLKFSASGGMATQRAVNDKWKALTDTNVIEGYGLTETSPVVTLGSMYEKEFTGSSGLPLPNTDLSIRDGKGVELALGEEGEVWIKGPQVMRGYWQRPEESANALTEDGWFKSGDIGRLDEKGRLFLVDRKKDMILVSGFNVYPNEIEDVLVGHEGVVEAAVVGVHSDRTGEAVKAFVVRSDPGLTAESLMAYSRKHLTAYKVPKIFEFKDELPKTNVGKVLRRVLRE